MLFTYGRKEYTSKITNRKNNKNGLASANPPDLILHILYYYKETISTF